MSYLICFFKFRFQTLGCQNLLVQQLMEKLQQQEWLELMVIWLLSEYSNLSIGLLTVYLYIVCFTNLCSI